MTETSLRTASGTHDGEAAPLLQIAHLTMRFGGIVALDDVNFAVSDGRIVGLIGPNGAGKTTLFNCLSRLYRPERGDICLNGASLRHCAPSDIAAKGIGRTFQNPALFASMSVLDNVKVGAHARGRNSPLSDAVTLPSARREERDRDRTARAMLAFVGLEHAGALPAAGLSFAARKRVELARALAAQPQLLLLDEPAGGLNHDEVAELGVLIRAIRDSAAHHRAPGRASHGSGDEPLRSGRGAQFRPRDRRRRPGRGTQASGRDRSLSGKEALMAPILELRAVKAFYGQSEVLHGIDVAVEDGGMSVLLGANGAGKTTTLRAISGMVRSEGEIHFAGQRLERRSTEAIAGLGVAHVPEGRGTMTGLTVEENLRLGAYTRAGRPDAGMARMYDYFPILGQRRRQQAGALSGGEQQMLAIARALMMSPRLLILDEPSFGLAPRIVEDIFAIVERIRREQHVAVLLVEQNATLALELADQAYLLETGYVVMSGPAKTLADDPQIRRSYLGY